MTEKVSAERVPSRQFHYGKRRTELANRAWFRNENDRQQDQNEEKIEARFLPY